MQSPGAGGKLIWEWDLWLKVNLHGPTSLLYWVRGEHVTRLRPIKTEEKFAEEDGESSFPALSVTTSFPLYSFPISLSPSPLPPRNEDEETHALET